MIKHNFKVAIRNFWKDRFFTLINVSGLAVGMAGAILLLLWIQYQFSIDRFHEKGKNIYKIYANQKINGDIYSNPSIPEPLSQLLKDEVAEVNGTTRLLETEKFIRYAEINIQSGGICVDPSFLNMFSFPLVEGDKATVLQNPRSIILSEKLAKKLFKNDDPIGKIIQADQKESFIVKGIIKDLPTNTQFKFDFILSWQYLLSKPNHIDSWENTVTTFVELRADASVSFLDKKITALAAAHTPKEDKVTLFLYPLEKLGLRSHFENGKPAGGLIDTVRILISIAFAILLIACINFVNLSTARSSKRAKEVGIRKVMGVSRISLIWQFINESILLSFIAGVIALIIVAFALPSFNNLTQREIHIQIGSISFWLSFLGFILFTGVLSGSYPAFVLSSFLPIKVLKGVFQKNRNFISPRKLLVVSQFSFAVVLINFTIMLQRQIAHIEGRQAGFGKENLIFHRLTKDIEKNYAVLKNELIQSGVALFVNTSNVPITKNGPLLEDIYWPGKSRTDKVGFELRTSNQDFVGTNGTTLLQGRDIDVENFPTDTSVCLVNEVALKIMDYRNPIGQIIQQGNTRLKIIGVVKNFISGSPMQEISPVVIRRGNNDQYLNIRINNRYTSLEGEQKVTAIIKKYNSGSLTEFQFADEDYALKIRGIKLTAKLTYIFASIALFISCLGLFGLVVYVIGNKAKEISIRKVFGGGIVTITGLLTKDFVKLVLISIFIASPISWLLMSSFLHSFYYRINLTFLILLESALIVLGITIVTISGQSVRAAIRTPVKNLRDE